MEISDRTAAVKWSQWPNVIDRKIEKAAEGDDPESEDLPVERTYRLLRAKEGYVPRKAKPQRFVELVVKKMPEAMISRRGQTHWFLSKQSVTQQDMFGRRSGVFCFSLCSTGQVPLPYARVVSPSRAALRFIKKCL